MPKKKPVAVVYAVERFHWRRIKTGWSRLPGEVRLATHQERTAADADADTREQKARAFVKHPFACGTALHHLTTMPEPVFLDWVLEAGIDPPADKKGRDWFRWAVLNHKKWTPAQLAHLWAGCNRATFFRVVERPAGAVMYAVVRVGWNYNDEWWYAEPDGGQLDSVHRTREAAEAMAEGGNDIARDVWGEEIADMYDEDAEEPAFEVADRRLAQADPFAPLPKVSRNPEFPVATAPFYEVIEIEWRGSRG